MEAPGDDPPSAPESELAEPTPSDRSADSESLVEPTMHPGAGEGPRRPSRRHLWVAIAVVAVVILVVLGLSLTGLLGSRYDLLGPKSAPGESVTFSEAYDAANATAQSQGGAWGLVDAAGFDIVAGGAFKLPQQNDTSSPCYAGAVPALANSASGDAAKGLSPYWVFGFESTTNLSLLGVVVVNGQAQFIGTTPADHPCDGPARVGLLASPSSIEDSPKLVHSLSNLTPFLGAYSNSSVLFSLTDEGGGASGKISGTAFWTVGADPCYGGLSSGASLQSAGDPEYLGGTNATAGTVALDESLPGYGACETPGTLSPALHLSATVGVTNPITGGTNYTDVVTSVNGSFGAVAFHPRVYPGPFGTYAANAFASSQLSFSVLNATGASVVSYNFTTEQWGFGGEYQIVAGDSLVLHSEGSLETASLVLIGDPPLTGQIGIFLP